MTESRLRIAMVGSRGVPARHGGVETAVEELSARLVARGHEVTVYCRHGDYPPHERPTRHRGISCRYLPSVTGKHSAALAHAGLATAAAVRSGADVIHYHAMGPTLFSPAAHLRRRTAVLATVQGRDDQRAKWSPAAQRLLGAAAWTSTHVPDVTIAVSSELRDELARDFGCDAVHLPNGISAPSAPVNVAERNRILAGFGLTAGGYLLNVGRLVPEKALDTALGAYREVTGTTPFVVAGDASSIDPYLRSVKALVAADERLRLLGPVHGVALDTLFRNARAFVQVSRLEGLPLALLEAASYGRPLLVSGIGPHLEVVDGPGPGRRIVALGDGPALVAALQAAATEPPDQAGAAALGQSVLRRFDWEGITDTTVELYRSALARRQAS